MERKVLSLAERERCVVAVAVAEAEAEAAVYASDGRI